MKIYLGYGREKGRISEDYEREMEISNKVKEGTLRQTKITLLSEQASSRLRVILLE